MTEPPQLPPDASALPPSARLPSAMSGNSPPPSSPEPLPAVAPSAQATGVTRRKSSHLRSTAQANKKRGGSLLMMQIGIGGTIGVVIALAILKILNVGPFRIDQVAQSAVNPLPASPPGNQLPPKQNRPDPLAAPVKRPNPNAAPPARDGDVIDNRQPPGAEPFDEATSPFRPERRPSGELDALSETEIESAPTRVVFPELFDLFRRANVNQSARVWWCPKFGLALDDQGTFRSVDDRGEKGFFYPIGATEQYVEVESESGSRRLRLFAAHVEMGLPPFKEFKPFQVDGAWAIGPEQTEIDWFPGALNELEKFCSAARYTLNEAMVRQHEKVSSLFLAKQLKNVPFGFDPTQEGEKFRTQGLISWAEPLLPMTEQYISECGKLHRAQEVAYAKVASRLKSPREQLAKGFLAFHQWRFTATWPVAVLKWTDPATGTEVAHTLFSNGTVNDEFSKNGWKLAGGVLRVDLGDKAVRIRIGQTGKEFTVLDLETPIKGIFETNLVRQTPRWSDQ
jgi:hypothetical protein